MIEVRLFATFRREETRFLFLIQIILKMQGKF